LQDSYKTTKLTDIICITKSSCFPLSIHIFNASINPSNCNACHGRKHFRIARALSKSQRSSISVHLRPPRHPRTYRLPQIPWSRLWLRTDWHDGMDPRTHPRIRWNSMVGIHLSHGHPHSSRYVLWLYRIGGQRCEDGYRSAHNKTNYGEDEGGERIGEHNGDDEIETRDWTYQQARRNSNLKVARSDDPNTYWIWNIFPAQRNGETPCSRTRKRWYPMVPKPHPSRSLLPPTCRHIRYPALGPQSTFPTSFLFPARHISPQLGT
jgi:hypothetical protein